MGYDIENNERTWLITLVKKIIYVYSLVLFSSNLCVLLIGLCFNLFN